jgi:hypothetical protein
MEYSEATWKKSTKCNKELLLEGVRTPWNFGFQKRGPKDKWTVYYYQHPQIWKPNDGSEPE